MTDDVAHAPAMSSAAGPATVRQPEVAGAFYPADPGVCADLVTRCLDGARPAPPGEPKVIVVPHAGHVYSGPVAGTAYAPLAKRSDRITHVVMLGPAHRVGFAGVATTAADAWASPLGTVPVDWPAMRPLLSRPGFRVADAVFAHEHCLEVQLPFLQRVLDDFSIVPVLVGDASQDEVASVLEALWGGPETLILISTDLSHFHDYVAARRLDGETTRRIELMQPEDIDGERACGYRGLGGALKRAQELDLRVTALDVRNSGDTSGTKDRVVGYGAFAMEYAESARLSDDDRDRLLHAARAALAFGAEYGRPMAAALDAGLPPSLKAMRASFITLRIGDELRGCCGTVTAREPLLLDVAANAYKAGFDDPRFGPMRAAELGRVDVSISVLSTPRPIRFAEEADLLRQIRPDRDGLVVEDGDRRGVFLPSVWERFPVAAQFVDQLKRKAEIAPDHLSEGLRVSRFTAESFGGPFRAG